MDKMLLEHMSRAEQYQALLEMAARQEAGHILPQPVVVPADTSYFFPWESSPYRANGTTTAEQP